MTNTFGFYVSELRIKGANLPDAVVAFGPGLSVVAGPSNTGKSFIRDAINHVFGSSEALRDLSEKRGYDRILVEITSYEDNTITLERAWSGGAIALYESIASDVEHGTAGVVLSPIHSSKDDNVSRVLLDLCGLSNVILRTNNSGATRGISFRDLKDYTLISEGRMIDGRSPVHSGNFVTKTVETSLFQALLTGSDDSTVLEVPNNDVVRIESNAQRSIFVQLRNDISTRLAQIPLTEADLLRQADDIDARIQERSEVLSRLNNDSDSVDSRRRNIWQQKERARSRLDEIESMTSKFELLAKKYSSDIERLQSNAEAGSLFGGENAGECPICGSPPEHHNSDILFKQTEIDDYTEACNAEISKIGDLQVDLSATMLNLIARAAELRSQLEALENDYRAAQAEILSILAPTIASETNLLSELVQSRRAIDRSLSIYAEGRRLTVAEQSMVAPEVKSTKAKQEFSSLSPNDYDEFANEVDIVLGEWSYPNLSRVTFDTKAEDVVISGKARRDNGKGYKAITLAAFMVALMRLCRGRELPHPGFLLLDSPLVTYREPTEQMGEGVKINFYRSLANLANHMQVIILENEEPPDEILPQIIYTSFTASSTGRYGLLPQ